MIPIEFKPFLWSYDFDKLDLTNNKSVIINSILDYGTFNTWPILFNIYSKEDIKSVAEKSSNTWNKKSANFWNVLLNSQSTTFIDRWIAQK